MKQAQNCEWIKGHKIRVYLIVKCTTFLTIISMKVTVTWNSRCPDTYPKNTDTHRKYIFLLSETWVKISLSCCIQLKYLRCGSLHSKQKNSRAVQSSSKSAGLLDASLTPLSKRSAFLLSATILPHSIWPHFLMHKFLYLGSCDHSLSHKEKLFSWHRSVPERYTCIKPFSRTSRALLKWSLPKTYSEEGEGHGVTGTDSKTKKELFTEDTGTF